MSSFDFDYYSGEDCEQFRFLKVAKVFFENPDFFDLSLAECVLYSVLLELVAYSKMNGWVDEEGHTYVIRSVESLKNRELSRYSTDSIQKFMNNLADFGLIEKKRRGQGKPDLIYVKDFTSKKPAKSVSEKSDDSCDKISEPEKIGFQKPKKSVSRTGKNRPDRDNYIDNEYIETPSSRQCIGNIYKGGAEENDGKNDKTEFGTQRDYSKPIKVTMVTQADPEIQAEPVNDSLVKDPPEIRDESANDSLVNDSQDMEKLIVGCDFPDPDMVEAYVRKQVNYEYYMDSLTDDYKRVYEILYNHIVRMLVGKRDTVTVQGADYSHKYVKRMYLRIDENRIMTALQQLAEKPLKMHNSSGYLDSVLFNVATATEVKEIMDNGGMFNPYEFEAEKRFHAMMDKAANE